MLQGLKSIKKKNITGNGNCNSWIPWYNFNFIFVIFLVQFQADQPKLALEKVDN